ncbi:MAG TPA: bifunctional DedA family/phosphatase PAP2 family protein [Ktedonobacterales bacterium]|nr:bifunctional DedA family/phosphatase PAP2 family protein [Ktedonobacterales bacterium]
MFTQLVTLVIGAMDQMPALLVYGLVAVWIGADSAGIPLPREAVLLFAGVLSAAGHVGFAVVVGSAVLGSVLFAGLAYSLGRHFGAAPILRLGRYVGFTPERAEHIEIWLRHRGLLGIVVANMLPMLRTFCGYIMGIAEMSSGKFLVGTMMGSLISAAIWIWVGSVFGANYHVPLGYIDRIGTVGLIAAVATIVGLVILHYLWGRRTLSRMAQHAQRHPLTATAQGSTSAFSASQQSIPVAGHSHREAASPSQSRERAPQMTSPTSEGGSSRPDHPSVATTPRHTYASWWPTWELVLLAGLWVAGAIALTVVSVFAHQYAAFPYDASFSAWVQQVRGTPFQQAINLAGDLQWFLPTGIALALIFGTLLFLRLFLEAICLAIASFGTDLVNVALNTVVARPRPQGVHIQTLAANLGQQSFPSGHVAHTVGLYGFTFFLCLVAIRAHPANWRWKPWLIVVQVICAYFLLFVGVSRVLEGQHWPSDVLAGYLVGALMLTLAIVLYTALRRRSAMHAVVGRASNRRSQPKEA